MRKLREDRNRLAGITKSSGVIVAAMLLLITLSSPANAVRCNEWSGLTPNDRTQRVKDLIRELMDSPRAAQWASINKSRIERCLVQQMSEIEIDFNDACSQGSQAPVDALDEILLKHARSCAQTAH